MFNSISDAAQLANDLRSTSDRIFDTSQRVDEDSLVEISSDLDALILRAEETRSQMWLLGLVSSGLGFVPLIGDSSGSALNMMDRTVLDLKAASSLLSAAISLSNLIDESARKESSVSSALSALPTISEIEKATDGLSEASIFLLQSEQLVMEMDTYTSQQSRLERADVALRKREAWITEMLDWSISANGALKAMTELEDAFGPLISLLDSPQQNMLQALEASKSIPEISETVGDIDDSLQSVVNSAPAAISSSRFGVDLADLSVVVGSADEVLVALNYVLEALSAAASGVSSAEEGLLGADTGLLQGLHAVIVRSDDLEEAEQLLTGANDRLIETEFSRSSLVSVSDLLRSVAVAGLDMTVMLRELSAASKTVLGVDEPQTYLVIGANADELRGSGGFVFGIWVMKIHNGQILSTDYQDIVALDDWAKLARYPDAPVLMQQNMDAQKILMRDVEWSPEFKRVAELAEEMWHLGGKEEQIDGVISLTQWALVDLVTNLGSIEVAAESVAGSEVMELLEIGTDEQGRQFADLVLKSVKEKLTSGMSRGQALSFFASFSSLRDQKDIIVHLFDDEANEALVRAGMGSSTLVESGDRLAVIDSNVGWNKVDRNISRSLRYSVDLSDVNSPRAQVEVSYSNSGIGSIDECATQLKKVFATYDEFTNGCYWDLLRLYVASGSELNAVDPLPLQANSVYHLLGLGVVGEDTWKVGADEGGDFVSGLIAVPPGESRSATIELALLPTVIEQAEGVSQYRLKLIAQPGARGRLSIVEIEVPAGTKFEATNPVPDSVDGNVLSYSLNLSTDATLTLDFIPDS